MPRLDARRMQAWLAMERVVNGADRAIDTDLRHEWAVPLGWFEVLRALRDLGGRARPIDIAHRMNVPPSSLSRRLDRIEEEGWIARRAATRGDGREIEVELTEPGRKLWREMNVSYRRAVQHHVVRHLSDDQIDALIDIDATVLAADVDAR